MARLIKLRVQRETRDCVEVFQMHGSYAAIVPHQAEVIFRATLEMTDEN